MDSQYFSEEGFEKLKKELEERVSVLRPEIAMRIKEAKELGDISENAEYTEAKEAQSLNEGRAEEIKKILDNAVIITEEQRGNTIHVGSRIKVQSKNGIQEYSIVGAAESDPLKGFISNESPLGSAFLGKKKGTMLKIQTPSGETEYKVLEIK